MGIFHVKLLKIEKTKQVNLFFFYDFFVCIKFIQSICSLLQVSGVSFAVFQLLVLDGFHCRALRTIVSVDMQSFQKPPNIFWNVAA